MFARHYQGVLECNVQLSVSVEGPLPVAQQPQTHTKKAPWNASRRSAGLFWPMKLKFTKITLQNQC
jgi:hypothetical protein